MPWVGSEGGGGVEGGGVEGGGGYEGGGVEGGGVVGDRGDGGSQVVFAAHGPQPNVIGSGS